ncbi:MAG: SPFH domain-containing protein [Candidatus Melainabacteria bacterium]|nr:SPFH domain-containing protein [Candidatus Melainabacteria bacterium]
MENIVWVAALILGYAFLVNRSNLEKDTAFVFGLLFATLIAMFLGGSSIVSQIGWIAVCQFAWTLFHGVHMGFRRFRNTLVVAIAITVVLSTAFLLKVSSPPGFATVAAVLLVGRWLLSSKTSLKTGKNAAVKKDPNEVGTVKEFREIGEVREIGKRNKSLQLAISTSHKAALASGWLYKQIGPYFYGNKRRNLIAMFLCTFFLSTWHGSNGLILIREGSVALVREPSGIFQEKVLEPGLRAVIPYLQQMVVVPTSTITLPRKERKLLISGSTSDGFKVTIRVQVAIKLSSDFKLLIPFYQGKYRGDPLPAVTSSLRTAFSDYLKTSRVQNFLPVVGRSIDIEQSLLPYAQAHLAANEPAIDIEEVTVVKIWNESLLQVPIDALQQASNVADELANSIRDAACKDNPNCL